MDHSTRQKLAELHAEFLAHDAKQSDRLNRWRNLEPESALFLSILVRGKQARQVLEIGTSNGFSTLWLADALNSTQGFLTTLEIDPARTQLAQTHLNEFGLAARVNCLTIDAAVFLSNAQGIYDLIFLDAERDAYVAYWPDLQRLLSEQPGSVLIVDNVISHQAQVQEFLSCIQQTEAFISTVIPLGAGLLMVTR